MLTAISKEMDILLISISMQTLIVGGILNPILNGTGGVNSEES